mmetsp:Transcript_30875/g.42222  ORF Transcript_30875/g.42222 Transcript_30875/m.42222 type:complete len:226 (-) Transcript_30875:53-730(-)
MASREYLLKHHNLTMVKLTSSNSYSQGETTLSLGDYIYHHVDNTSTGPASESLYLFGGNYDGIWKEFANIYESPPCKYCDKAGAKTFGIGGQGSGVSFHLHGPGFSEPLVGGKRWFLFPPRLRELVSLSIGPNTTALSWLHSQYPLLWGSDYSTGVYSNSSCADPGPLSLSPEQRRQLGEGLQECQVAPGELLFFPAMWMHATLNTAPYNVFVSVFLDTQLMRED